MQIPITNICKRLHFEYKNPLPPPVDPPNIYFWHFFWRFALRRFPGNFYVKNRRPQVATRGFSLFSTPKTPENAAERTSKNRPFSRARGGTRVRAYARVRVRPSVSIYTKRNSLYFLTRVRARVYKAFSFYVYKEEFHLLLPKAPPHPPNRQNSPPGTKVDEKDLQNPQNDQKDPPNPIIDKMTPPHCTRGGSKNDRFLEVRSAAFSGVFGVQKSENPLVATWGRQFLTPKFPGKRRRANLAKSTQNLGFWG